MSRRPGLPADPLDHPGATVAAGVFGTVARIRGGRGLHPLGAAFHATLRVPGGGCPGVPLLDEPGEHAAVVRFSNALGVPRGWPDGLGIAVRVPDAHGPGRHQDLLVTSTIDEPLLRHLPLPAPLGFARTTFTGLTPFRLAGRRRMLGARSATPFPAGPYADLDAVRAAAAAGGLRFSLLAGPVLGRLEPVAEIAVGAPLSPGEEARLDLDPSHTGGGIEPVPLLMRARRAAYAASRARRPVPDSDG